MASIHHKSHREKKEEKKKKFNRFVSESACDARCV